MKRPIIVVTLLVMFQTLTTASILVPFDKTWSAPFENVVNLISVPKTRGNVDSAAKYRLPNDTAPSYYEIILKIDPLNTKVFTGKVLINIDVLKETKEIILHGKGLKIEKKNVKVLVKSNTKENVPDTVGIKEINIANDTHFVNITTEDTLSQSVDKYLLSIEYEGTYNEGNLLGLYVSRYTNEEGENRSLVATQFQPGHARSAFPCYDEPGIKAIFKIKIYAAEGYKAISNMDVDVDDDDLEKQEGFELFSFAPTLKMSTYLIAFVVSDFKFDKSNKPDKLISYSGPFRVHFRPGQRSTLDFALKFGPDNLGAIENFVNYTYAFPKMDKIAIPDLSAEAMGNWGLVTYREEYLMWTKGISTTRNMHDIGTIISHENSHMWFGNEVSPDWWDYLWLTEGFATYFEYYGTDLVYPEWRLKEQFNVLYHQGIMLADSLPSTNAMNNPVFSPDEVDGQFNQIAFAKAGSVIKMIANVLGEDKFRKALHIYLDKNHRKTAVPKDLYDAIESVVDDPALFGGHSVATVFSSWADQPGYPVVYVQRDKNRLLAKQKRFYQNHTLSTKEEWYIPLNVASSSNNNFTDTRTTAWLRPRDQAIQISFLSDDDDWFIINKQEKGYYRVHYDDKDWLALGKALKADNFSGIHVLNRAQVVDDAMNLAKAGYLNYEIALDVVSFMANEIDYIPWVSANAALTYVHRVMRTSKFIGHLEKYILTLVTKVYNNVSYDINDVEEVVTRYNRIIALNWACSLGHENCAERCIDDLDEWQKNISHTIHPDVQSVVFCTALRSGNHEEFNFLWQRYVNTIEASQRNVILSSLGCASEIRSKQTLLDYSIAVDSGIRNQDRHAAVISVANSGPEGLILALEFMNNNFTQMREQITSRSGIPNIINNIGLRLVDQKEIDLFNEFVKIHEEEFTGYELSSVESAKANAHLNQDWQTRYMPDVDKYLSNAEIPSAGMLLVGIISTCLVFFNIN